MERFLPTGDGDIARSLSFFAFEINGEGEREREEEALRCLCFLGGVSEPFLCHEE